MENNCYDLVIKDGHIVDGSGNPWYKADIGIKDGRIKHIGLLKNESTHACIQARGRVVSPGFIDLHNHSDLNILARPSCESNIM